MTITGKEIQKIFHKLWHENKWVKLREYLFKWLVEEPDDHWLLIQISHTYYFERQFEQALEYALKAFESNPRCPEVTWQYAESLISLGRNSEAEPLYRSLIRRGVNRIARGKCREGFLNAKQIVNDSRYGLGFVLANKSEFSEAERYIKSHIAYRKRKYPSTLRLRSVRKDLALIKRGEKPSFES